jgi:hypothetical protein
MLETNAGPLRQLALRQPGGHAVANDLAGQARTGIFDGRIIALGIRFGQRRQVGGRPTASNQRQGIGPRKNRSPALCLGSTCFGVALPTALAGSLNRSGSKGSIPPTYISIRE